MSSQIRISNRLRDEIHRFRSLHNTYEEKAGYQVVTLAVANDIDILHAALSRASISMEEKIRGLDRAELQDKAADLEGKLVDWKCADCGGALEEQHTPEGVRADRGPAPRVCQDCGAFYTWMPGRGDEAAEELETVDLNQVDLRSKRAAR